jgi:SAM-dependent methyltransferase
VHGEVLDLACGRGRHCRLLASRGYDVLAVDRDSGSLSELLDDCITTLQWDLENGASGGEAHWPFEENRFAGIVVTNYLHRPLFPHIAASLMHNGILIYETFSRGNEQFGKPSNPDVLLATGELLDVAASNSLRVIAYEDGYVERPKPAMMQRICAVKAPSDRSPSGLQLI